MKKWQPYYLTSELPFLYRIFDFFVMKGQKYRNLLKNTVDTYQRHEQHYQSIAKDNLDKWKQNCDTSAPSPLISFSDQDTLTEALLQTIRTGEEHTVVCFANAENVGGVFRYWQGSQEEDIARRTNFSLTIQEDDIQSPGQYTPEMTAKINAEKGEAYINPQPLYHVADANGKVLSVTDQTSKACIFRFTEARIAADDLRVKVFGIPLPFFSRRFNEQKTEQKIKTLLDELVRQNKTHVILGALGCGAFKNPPDKVALIFKRLLAEDKYKDHFKSVVFAIRGKHGKNYQTFKSVFSQSLTQDLIFDDALWTPRVTQIPFFQKRVPTGVQAMRDCVQAAKNKGEPVRLEALKEIAQTRLSANKAGFFGRRSAETDAFYRQVLSPSFSLTP